MTLIRVARGQPRPADTEFQAALERDRQLLHLPRKDRLRDMSINGPYAITIDGRELDEYVVWER